MPGEIATAAEAENVLIRASACAITVLPQYGGKIASIRVGEQELLQAPLTSIASRTRNMGFDESDASGWDECLPSVGACLVSTDAGNAEVPDHGDLWRVAWQEEPHQGAENGQPSHPSVALTATCFSLPLELQRKIELRETTRGWRLDLSYTLRNLGSFSVPWSWSAHPLFAVEAGDRIVLPDSTRRLRLEGSGGARLGQSGDTVAWPIATLPDAGTTDLSLAAASDSRIGDKLFAGPLGDAENWCELLRPSAALRIRVTFDPAATPYLGLWICYGGWPQRPGPKQMCVAMEPSTAPVDSLAVTGPWSRTLAPDECFNWKMEVEIERIET
jgi:galactose mutarotase-like enzyme